MGMSTHIVGFRPPDENYFKMKAVWDACAAAGVLVPDEVDIYFDGTEPDPVGMEVDLSSIVEEWADRDYREGLQFDVEKIPSGVRYIRFYNSW